jgi:hypothetical protein
MLMKSAVLAASDSYSTSFVKTTCSTSRIPVSPDGNLNMLYNPFKRSLEELHLEIAYDGKCTESDILLTDTNAIESHTEVSRYESLRSAGSRYVSLRSALAACSNTQYSMRNSPKQCTVVDIHPCPLK